ncbi:hypothetical protein [uncultured Cardiobacterium sp.]|uniref:hypothetical protein n=1 Tax=uncultured Cardiobacterium sp. TaxID=417619 RepID=UPI00260B3BB0|nr:hypothetical protein [uncultured Cardiobacterium sp.]
MENRPRRRLLPGRVIPEPVMHDKIPPGGVVAGCRRSRQKQKRPQRRARAGVAQLSGR